MWSRPKDKRVTIRFHQPDSTSNATSVVMAEYDETCLNLCTRLLDIAARFRTADVDAWEFYSERGGERVFWSVRDPARPQLGHWLTKYPYSEASRIVDLYGRVKVNATQSTSPATPSAVL